MDRRIKSSKKIQKSLQLANKSKVKYVIIVGDEELKNKKVKLKNMYTREETEIAQNSLINHIEKLFKTGK